MLLFPVRSCFGYKCLQSQVYLVVNMSYMNILWHSGTVKNDCVLWIRHVLVSRSGFTNTIWTFLFKQDHRQHFLIVIDILIKPIISYSGFILSFDITGQQHEWKTFFNLLTWTSRVFRLKRWWTTNTWVFISGLVHKHLTIFDSVSVMRNFILQNKNHKQKWAGLCKDWSCVFK